MSISGIMRNSGRNVNVGSGDTGASRYTGAIKRLPEIHTRLSKVQIEHRDFRDLFPVFTAPNTLIYCDPPYLHETRSEAKIYKHEMSNKDHEDLLDALIEYPQMAILSGYDNGLYNNTLKDWKRLVLSTADYKITHTAKESKPNEILWLNPLAWGTLHKDARLSLF
jgi:DNA adenine methylase